MNHVPVVAFYLPQFHAIPENDEWWGEGFTEWTNVRRSRPLFEGHVQPYGPDDDTGHYDLTDLRVMQDQFGLAQENGIDAFCFYHYWFDGTRLLDRPVDQFLASDISGKFCLSWANENWTRRWDGKANEVLIEQRYDDDSAAAVFESFLPALRDTRYFERDGRKVLLVHRVDHLPEAAQFAKVWREAAREAGVGELLLVASETVFGLDPRDYGFDAAAEFPPVGANDLSTAWRTPVSGLAPDFAGRLLSYPRLVEKYTRRNEPEFLRFRGVTPSWDNTPRRGHRSTVFIGSTPGRFSEWAQIALRREADRPDGPGLLFVNAWNEWAEGAVLESSQLHGLEYLKAVRTKVVDGASVPAVSRGSFSFGHLRSVVLLAAGTLKHGLQRIARRIRRVIPGRI